MLSPASVADAPLLAALHAPSFPDEPWSAESFTSLLESSGVFGLIGYSESCEAPTRRPSGFILCRIAVDEGEVLTLSVLPALRRSGLGGRLLAGALVWWASCGTRTVFLEVAEDNAAAQALYHCAGFKPVGRRPGYYPRGAAAIVLARDLTVY